MPYRPDATTHLIVSWLLNKYWNASEADNIYIWALQNWDVTFSQ